MSTVSISDACARPPCHRAGSPARPTALRATLALACLAVVVLAGLIAPSALHSRASTRARAGSRLARALPLALAPAASASLGAAERRFWALHRGGGLRAQGGDLDTAFTAAGPRVLVGRDALQLTLSAVGRGGTLATVAPVAPAGARNEVLYRHGAVTEYYRNGPYGLEQGFTLRRRPNGAGGSFVLMLSWGGSLKARAHGSAIVFHRRGGAAALRYAQLSASDASGRPLPARAILSGHTLELRVDDRGARYPVRVDPFMQSEKKITGKSESGAGLVGFSAALSADGNTALVGAPGDNEFRGAAWVFVRSEGKWVQEGEKLVPSGETGAGVFGFSVALSADGNTAAIGGSADSSEVGAAWVFTRKEGKWSQQGGKIKGIGEIGSGHFGFATALSADGNTLLVGAPYDTNHAGAVWVFTRSGGEWTQQGGKLTGAGEIGGGQVGYSVALSADAGTALVGGPEDGNKDIGAAWVFTRSGSTWAQQAELKGGEEEKGTGRFGESVALSADGSTAAVGAPSDQGKRGGAWMFARTEVTWTQQGKKLEGGGEEHGAGEFGESVALSADGNTALVGAPKDEPERGAAWAFTRSEGKWSQQGTKLTGTEASGTTGRFGASVALSADASTAVIGGKGDAGEAGAVWVFLAGPTVVTGTGEPKSQTEAKLNGTVNPNGNLVKSCEFQYGTSTGYGKTAPCAPAPGAGSNPVAVSAAIKELIAGTTYHFRIVASNEVGTSYGADQTFTTLATPPAVETKAAESITQTSAVLKASVNPNGGNVTTCTFEYGEVTLSKSVPCSSLPGSGKAPVVVSAQVSKLKPSKLYKFRILAANTGGPSTGGELTLLTSTPEKPEAKTQAASLVTQTSATLNASVNPHGASTKCYFKYGPTTIYGSTAKCSAEPGEEGNPVSVSAVLHPLTPNSTYHFRIVAVNELGESEGGDQEFTTPKAAAPVAELGEPSSVTQSSATLNASVNPEGSNVTECKFEYGTTTFSPAPCSPAELGGEGSPVPVTAEIKSLQANTLYHFRVTAKNAQGETKSSERTFTTKPNLPTSKTEGATLISQVSATLNATVNPNGVEVTGCTFEYGTTPPYSSIPCSGLPGSGTNPVPVAAPITALTANTTYHFRIVATNAGGTSEGAEQEFTTLPKPPTVVTGQATAATQTSATLNATVNPNGGEVSECKFQYGPTTAYGSTASCSPSPGHETVPVPVSATLSELAPNSTYHVRIVAKNAGGPSEGKDETFKTLPYVAPTAETGLASAVAQTSATLNGTVNPNGIGVTKCEFPYSAGTQFKSVPCSALPGSGTSPVPVAAPLTGLTPNTTYYFHAVAKNVGLTGEGAERTLTTLPATPATGHVSAVAQTTATLNATVNTEGNAALTCTFVYGLSTTPYESSVPCSTQPEAGTGEVKVSAALKGLKPNATYHFRVVAANPTGSATGAHETLKTPAQAAPTVVTGSAGAITQTSATLNGTVNPNGGELSQCGFEYGTTIAYGSSIACAERPGAESVAVAVSSPVSGLAPNTTYHFRIIAINATGSTQGTDQTFTTSAAAPQTQPGTAMQPGPGAPPAPTASPAQPPTLAPGGLMAPSGATLASTVLVASLSHGTVKVKLFCPAAAGSCAGTLKVQTLPTAAAGSRRAKKRVVAVTLARGSFAIVAGQAKTLKLRLSGAARALLGHAPKLRARAALANSEPAGAAATQTPVTLRAGK